MGFLDILRGSRKEKQNLPMPVPVKEGKKKVISDIPPIKPKIHEPDLKNIKPPTIILEAMDKPPMKEIVRPTGDVKHIFVSSNDYSAILDKTNVIRSKLLESDEVLQKLTKLASVEEKELQKWQAQLEGLEKKLSYMETVLAKSGEV